MEKELSPLEIRQALGWSQEKMAEYLGLDRSSVSHIENGRALSGPVLRLMEDLEKKAKRKLQKQSAAA